LEPEVFLVRMLMIQDSGSSKNFFRSH